MILLLTYIWIGVFILSTANLLWWSYRSAKEWGVLKRYPFRTRFTVTLSFSSRWRQIIAPEDLPVLEHFRSGFVRNYYLFFCVPFFGISLILFLLNYQEYLEARDDLAETQLQLEQIRQKL